MKIVILALWALMASASTDIVHDKRVIGISSGYGGAYGYAPTLNFARVTSPISLRSSGAISSGYGGAYGYVPIPKVVNADIKLQSNDAISNGYAGAYGYATTPSSININKDLPSGIAISSGYGGAYGYYPTSTASVNKVIDMQKELKIPQVMNMRKMLSYSPGYSGYGNEINSYSGYSRYPDNTRYGFAYASGWL